MTEEASMLQVSFDQSHQKFLTISITVSASLVDRIYRETSVKQKEQSHTFGFTRGQAPLSYIDQAFSSDIIEHVQQFLLNYLVRNQLYHELRAQKMVCAGEPRLRSCKLARDADAIFIFECSVPELLSLKGWKYYPFRAPRRKNYRDLDRQVQLFIGQEEQAIADDMPVEIGDWVCFQTCVTDTEKCPLLDSEPQTWWLKIGNEEIDRSFQHLFCGKKLGDHFYTSDANLQEQFSSHLDTRYIFGVTIKDIVYDKLFSVSNFKSSFRLRTNKEVHKKLIEVFSFRNDISQRREMVEEAFKVMFMHHRIEVPRHVALRQQQLLLVLMQDVPDYHVYKTQQDFNITIAQLAEKQIREIILIDQLSIKENIQVTHQDVKQYLNLLKRPRTKEFIHFGLPDTKLNGSERPISEAHLKRHCLREKTLNHIIYHLTKK